MNNKCPYCGATEIAPDMAPGNWLCGTSFCCDDGSFRRHIACYERQLDRMQPVVDAAVCYEDQWHGNPNLQVALHELRVAVVQYNEAFDE